MQQCKQNMHDTVKITVRELLYYNILCINFLNSKWMVKSKKFVLLTTKFKQNNFIYQ